MKRRDFIKQTGIGITATFALNSSTDQSSWAKDESERKPNIIFILADDLGYGDLGCYGQRTILTPHLDKMAAEGVRFTQCYSGSTVCAPSRCALMTGCHTGHARIRGNKNHPLLPDDVTVAEIAKQAGYATGIIGKWGLGEPGTTGIPNRKGFDYWFGYLNQTLAHNYHPEILWRNEEEVQVYGEYSQDLFTREALDFVRKNQAHPFFLYLAYTTPHANNEKKNEGMEVPTDAPYTNKPWPQPQKNHAAMITRLDADIGKLLAQLQELKLEKDTLIFFSSDNGPHKEGGADPFFFDSNGPVRGYKRDLYDGGIRIPMIVRQPGTIAAGRVSDQVWAFWDFLPTVAELLGQKAPEGIDGISMLPVLLDKPQLSHAYLYWEFDERGFQQAVRMGDWKGIRLKLGEPIELYNLKADIGETTNIAEAHPEIVSQIETILKTARTESELYPVK